MIQRTKPSGCVTMLGVCVLCFTIYHLSTLSGPLSAVWLWVQQIQYWTLKLWVTSSNCRSFRPYTVDRCDAAIEKINHIPNYQGSDNETLIMLKRSWTCLQERFFDFFFFNSGFFFSRWASVDELDCNLPAGGNHCVLTFAKISDCS